MVAEGTLQKLWATLVHSSFFSQILQVNQVAQIFFLILIFWLTVNQCNSRSPKRCWEIFLGFLIINICSQFAFD